MELGNVANAKRQQPDLRVEISCKLPIGFQHSGKIQPSEAGFSWFLKKHVH